MPQDYAQARDWYSKAVAQGHESAQERLDDLYAQGKVRPVGVAGMSLDDTLAYINEILKEHDKGYISIQGPGKIVAIYWDTTLKGEAYGADIERVEQRYEDVDLICKKEVGNCWKTAFGFFEKIGFPMGGHIRNQERLVKAFKNLITKIVEEYGTQPPEPCFADCPDAPKSQPPIQSAPSQFTSSDELTLDSLVRFRPKPRMPEPLKGKSLMAEEIFAINNNTVYLVYAKKTGSTSNISQGSGVAVSEDTLLTNCHILEGQNEFYLMKQDLVIDAILTFADVPSDRCILFTPTHKLIPIKGIRPLSSLTIGEPVYTIGSPRSMENTLGQGLISGIRNAMGRSWIQTTAEISPGSSGGGLFDQKGNLIGITTFLLEESQGLNFAISAADFWD